MTIRVWACDSEAGLIAFRAKVLGVGIEWATEQGNSSWQTETVHKLTLTAPHRGLIQMCLQDPFGLDRTLRARPTGTS